METELKINGVYNDYEKYKMYSNAIADGLLRLDSIEQDIKDLKQEYHPLAQILFIEVMRVFLEHKYMLIQLHKQQQMIHKVKFYLNQIISQQKMK